MTELSENAGVTIDPKPSLKEKLSRVAAQCAYVRKDGVNLFHKYNYATAATIFERINEALGANRLVSCPWFHLTETSARTNAKGGSEQLVTVETVLKVIDLDSSEVCESNGFGSGQDQGDKAVMKAQTAALKYAWIMLLNISTGDDPEDDATVDSRASGEPIHKRKTPEEYQKTVERNKAAKLSPVAVALSEQINRELEEEKEARDSRLWPEPTPDSDPVGECPECGGVVLSYSSSKGTDYRQCSFAHELFMMAMKQGKSKADASKESKGHYYRVIP